jgi:hypothetical protein
MLKAFFRLLQGKPNLPNYTAKLLAEIYDLGLNVQAVGIMAEGQPIYCVDGQEAHQKRSWTPEHDEQVASVLRRFVDRFKQDGWRLDYVGILIVASDACVFYSQALSPAGKSLECKIR